MEVRNEDVRSQQNLALRMADGLRTVDRHIQSEYTNDIPTIMATISASPRYALTSGQSGTPLLTVLNNRDEVASYYAWTHQSHHEPIGTRHPKQVVTDWYVFCEALPSQRPVGGSEIVLTNYALLFPFADDGMIGEIMWKRSVFEEPTDFEDGDITVSAPFASGDTRSLRLFESFADATAASDGSLLRSMTTKEIEAAVPDQSFDDGRLRVMKGQDDVVDWFARLGRDADVLDAVSLNLIATSWYVFDEHLWVLRARKDGFFGHLKGQDLAVRVAGLYKIHEGGQAIDGVAAIARVEI
jgi:hypothetical protein